MDEPAIDIIDLTLPITGKSLPAFERPLQPAIREAGLIKTAPWIRTLGKLTLEVSTHGWRFPAPGDPPLAANPRPEPKLEPRPVRGKTPIKPPSDMVIFKDRLLYLLQPPLENLFANRQIELPFQPYPYQIKGIAFLMPRHAALLADEMGLGKTAQVIIALRLLFQSGLIRRALIVCPKPLVVNWTRELKLWAADLPYEVIGGDASTRKAQWLASRCPVKLVNYELLTRDEEFVGQTFLSAEAPAAGPGRQECLPHESAKCSVGQTFLSAEAPAAGPGRQECLPHDGDGGAGRQECLTHDGAKCSVGQTFLSAEAPAAGPGRQECLPHDGDGGAGRQECLPHDGGAGRQECLPHERLHFDIVVLDEAQRIKNRDAKTARVVRSIPRDRSWAMTGTPIENHIDDLINIFAFVDPERVPLDTPAKLLPDLTRDAILRRVKEEVMTDMPGKVIQDVYLDLSAAQRASYDLAEKEGIVHLNELGDTISVQHVFELVLRLKQICNFDPRTGESAKLEQLLADLDEVAENGRKAIVFSQWVEPLETLAEALAPLGALQYHGKTPQRERQAILDRFKADKSKHVLLMSYGTGSVGLNLQFTNYVFLFDRWWNPAIEDQAINRAHRIGQKETVFVKRFISQNTIEGRIAEVLDRKRRLFEELIGQNEAPPALGLSEDEIFGLFNVRPARRKPLVA